MKKTYFFMLLFVLNISNGYAINGSYVITGIDIENVGSAVMEPEVNLVIISKKSYSKDSCLKALKDEIIKTSPYLIGKMKSNFDLETSSFRICATKKEALNFINVRPSPNRVIFYSYHSFFKQNLEQKYQTEIKEIKQASKDVRKSYGSIMKEEDYSKHITDNYYKKEISWEYNKKNKLVSKEIDTISPNIEKIKNSEPMLEQKTKSFWDWLF